MKQCITAPSNCPVLNNSLATTLSQNAVKSSGNLGQITLKRCVLRIIILAEVKA